MSANTFKAPWGKTLNWISAFCIVIILAVTTAPLLFKINPEPVSWLVALPLLLLPVAALFVVRSYAIEFNELLIRRLLWTTRLPLAGLQSAEVLPDVMRGSLRLFGNGGMFSISGLYRNRALGNYRAFVTDLKKTVVLRFPKRTVVVSPENPEQFVAEISQFAFRTS
jgi:hypothetical protein